MRSRTCMRCRICRIRNIVRRRSGAPADSPRCVTGTIMGTMRIWMRFSATKAAEVRSRLPPALAWPYLSDTRLIRLRNRHRLCTCASYEGVVLLVAAEELDDESSEPLWRDGHRQILKEEEHRRVLAAQPKPRELSVEKTLEQLPQLPGIPRPVKSKLVLSESQEKAVESELTEAHDLRMSLTQPQSSAAEKMLQVFAQPATTPHSSTCRGSWHELCRPL